MFGRSIAILHRIERAVDSPQVPVANALSIGQRVFVEATFPEPLPVEVAGIGKVVHSQRQSPGRFWKRLRLLTAGPGPHVAHAHAAFFFHHGLGAGKLADCGVACGIAKEAAGEHQPAAGAGVEAGHALDPVPLALHCVGMGVE